VRIAEYYASISTKAEVHANHPMIARTIALFYVMVSAGIAADVSANHAHCARPDNTNARWQQPPLWARPEATRERDDAGTCPPDPTSHVQPEGDRR